MAREEYIRIYRSTTEGVTPSLTSGEIAANLADGNLFIGGSNGDLITYPQIPINANSLSGSIESLSIHSGDAAFLSVPIRTNLIKYSQDYVASGNDYWNAYGNNDSPLVSNLGNEDSLGWPGKGSTGGIEIEFKENPNNGIYQRIPEIVKNQVYTVSCWARSGLGLASGTARFSYYDGGLNRSFFSPDYALTAIPQRISFTFRAQSNDSASNIAFGNGSGNAAGTVYAWGFQLERGWIATSPIHNDTGAPKQSAAQIVKISSSFDAANFLMDDQGIVKLSATGTVPNTISTGLGASANADGSLAYLYFDPANLTFSSETTIDPNHDFLIFYDSNQAGLVKTKRIKPSKFMLDNDSIFSSKSSQFVTSKSSSNIEFEILTAGISAGETNLLTSGDAYTYITQNTIKSLNGQTGDVVVVGSLNGCTGTITITGTTNEVVISNSCPTITIGLPDNVSIPHLSVVGATFTGQVTLPNGQTLGDGVVTTVNGQTGGVGALRIPIGMTGSNTIRVITYPDGVTSQRADRSQYHISPHITLFDNSGFVVRANRTYFNSFSAPRSVGIKSIRIMSQNTGTTGSCYFSVWSANSQSGNPETRLYSSSLTTVGSGYNYTTITNAAGLVTVPSGPFWISVSFESSPAIYSFHKNYILPVWGTSDISSGYRYTYPIADTSGFTAPSSISAAGVTFAWMEWNPNSWIIPIIQWQSV